MTSVRARAMAHSGVLIVWLLMGFAATLAFVVVQEVFA